MKQKYNVTGMTCSACSAHVEKAVRGLDGANDVNVNLLSGTMVVEFDDNVLNHDKIIAAVEKAGYGAALPGAVEKSSTGTLDAEQEGMKKRLISSICILILLMYVSMQHMFGYPLPGFLSGAENALYLAVAQLVLTIPIMIINRKYYIVGFKTLFGGAPNMDSLIAIGSGAAVVYGLVNIFYISRAMGVGDVEAMGHYAHNLYFESAGMILTLITVGKYLEARSKGKTGEAISRLVGLAPNTVRVFRDTAEVEIPLTDVVVGDLVIVKPGERIGVDGIITEGSTFVDQSALTGESIPAEKNVGDRVMAATVNKNGAITFRAERVGEDTTLARIIRMVSDAAATKAPIAKIADKVSGVFVPAVIAISIVTFIVWLLVGQTVGYAVARAVSVLVISCPCALGLATPVAIMVGNGMGAKSGILFKTAASQEMAGKTQIVALDKTGTITSGIMQVTDVIPGTDTKVEDLLEAAYALEAKSEHPISKAIVEYAEKNQIKLSDTSDFEIKAGNGLHAKLGGANIFGGNAAYISESCAVAIKEAYLSSQITSLASQGKTPVLFARDNKLLGIIAVADTIKEDSAQAIRELKNMGIHTVMLTGDNEITARAIASQAGVDEIAAGLLPDGKEAVIRKLMESGKVAMVGDGINDAPSLTRADLGIAIGAGTDIAIDAADVVLMKGSLMDVTAAIRLSRGILRNIRENLFWAFFYNVIGIPLAAGCYIAAFGWTLNPMFGAAAMGLSSFCVVSNALRLNFLKTHDAKHDKKVKNPVKGNLISEGRQTQNTTVSGLTQENYMKISVKGMMCQHCEMHVKKALEAIDGITSATASHSDELVTIETSKSVDENLIKAAITDAGYEYAGVIA